MFKLNMASHALATVFTVLFMRHFKFPSLASTKLNQKIDSVSGLSEDLRHEIYNCVLTTGVIELNGNE